MELKCAVQTYSWGIRGMNSSVADLASASDPDLKVKDDTPYAELWMGTHSNGPSVIKETGEFLSDYIKKNNEVLGSNILNKFGNDLCFLFKVLSVNQALSIQAHPNKRHAEVLHRNRPEIYKDPNHKPEMAIAITPFQALCGFRPQEEIVAFLKELPELENIIGKSCSEAFIREPTEDHLKCCFSALINAPKDKLALSLERLKERLSTMDADSSDRLLSEVFLNLLRHYPGDGGCLAIYLLNFIALKPGEALFLGPNIIHAYLLGDCVECMACSDNVVRAGLTPKYQDVETLLSMLEYKMATGDSRKFEGSAIDEDVTLFNPPVPDFAVQMIKVKDSKTIAMTKEDSASILIVINGEGRDVSICPSISDVNQLKRGTILFLSAQQELSFQASGDFLAFRAFCFY